MGAASQFKQRYLFTNLTFMEEQYNVKVSWSFFATSHGKGVVEGIGGMVKRLVWSNNLAGKLITAKDFVEIANQNSSSIIVVYSPSEDINQFNEHLTERWENIYPLPETQSTHYVVPFSKYLIEYKEYFFSSEKKIFNFLN
ncbi:hypothetical protein AVEN_142371-1 [Araneus ventricosus]|uniref:Uncharacterized protein n=1 Tax=Araneus ventricosus TaxID=182803 RepID=A0A4Y2WVP5_ARAVE|nr:hypothetical protein AVEN_142371-1 [Araneus ventricosus]